MKKKAKPTILVIGAGSIGERHIRNLLALGITNIVVLRSRQLPLRTLDDKGLQIVTSMKAAMKLNPSAAIVCTPTSLHLEQAISCVREGLSVLVEKPLSDSKKGLKKLKKAARKSGAFVQVGYMMRFYPLLKRVKEMIDRNHFGGLVHFSSHWGEYLPDWHPWEDYREGYAARRDMGGGAGLTLSHDLDVALWMLDNRIEDHCAMGNYDSALEVDVDCAMDILLRGKNGVTAHVHQNFFERPARRDYTFRFNEATVTVHFFSNQLIVERSDGNRREEILPEFDRNDLFLDQTKDFLRRLRKGAGPKYTADQIANSRRLLNILA